MKQGLGAIYAAGPDGKLEPLLWQGYENEATLQQLIAENPHLLGGDQIDPDDPRRWQLVRREMTIHDAETGTGWWSVDHLFLDQDAIPTFVEVKRASDPRIRRETVGQMLDYAANASVHWTAHHIREALRSPEVDPDALVEEFSKRGSTEFWKELQRNLDDRKVRLLFVADHIPPKLRRVVEYLNEQMKIEVLAVEIRKYVADGKTVYVPYLFGNTSEATDRKSGGAINNFHGRLRFEEVRKLCQEKGDEIVVGYNDGLAALEAAPIEELKARAGYKWDFTVGGTGKKDPKRWFKGNEFLKVVSAKEG